MHDACRRSLAALFFVSGLLVAACRPKAPPADLKCETDDDCTFSCEPRGSCCHNPYCETAAHRDVASDAEKYNREHCTKDDYAKCPQIGARAEVGYTAAARCRNHTCVTERIPKDASR